MATHYSNLISTDPSTFAAPGRQPAGAVHVRTYKRRAAWTEPDNANGDKTRIMKIHSSERVWGLEFSCAAAGAGTVDLGVNYEPTDPDGIGTTIDDDEFATAIAITSANARTQVFGEAGAANDLRIGQRLWEIVGLTEDPNVFLELVATFDTGTSQAAAMVVVAELSNDSAG